MINDLENLIDADLDRAIREETTEKFCQTCEEYGDDCTCDQTCGQDECKCCAVWRKRMGNGW